jgi:hypothetical protein
MSRRLRPNGFFIAPIGAEGTETRDRSDGVLEYIVAPAAHDLGLTAVRADKIAKPGQITRQVIEHVVGARASVVDLTDANPNVYYEMAVRHTAQLPTVLIARDGEKLPFDISQMRTIFFDHTSLKSAAECRTQITQHLREALDGEVDSPIAASVTVQRLEHGTAQERVLAQLVDGIDEVRLRLREIDSRAPSFGLPPRLLREVAQGWMMLERAQDSGDLAQLHEAIARLGQPLRAILGDAEFARRARNVTDLDRLSLQRDAERRTAEDARLAELRAAEHRAADERRAAEHRAAKTAASTRAIAKDLDREAERSTRDEPETEQIDGDSGTSP